MNIAKALKVKSRLVGEVNRLKQIWQRENARRNDSVSAINVEQTYKEYLAASDQLVKFKTAIAVATAPAAGILAQLAEFKTQLAVLETIPVREGEELQYLGDSKTITYTWTSFLNREKIDNVKKNYQVMIENLQDQIDEFNAKTEIQTGS